VQVRHPIGGTRTLEPSNPSRPSQCNLDITCVLFFYYARRARPAKAWPNAFHHGLLPPATDDRFLGQGESVNDRRVPLGLVSEGTQLDRRGVTMDAPHHAPDGREQEFWRALGHSAAEHD